MRSFLVKHREFIGNVAIMMSGKTTASLIALVTMPIVARLFAPSDFGIAAMFVSIIGIVSTVGSLRYGAALVLPKDKPEALTLMALSYRVMFSLCAVLLLVIAVYEASGVNWSGLELLGGWVWLLPLGVLLSSALHIQESWLTRNKSFKTISASLIVGNASTSGFRIGFGALFGSSIYGLIVGFFLGTICRLAVQKSAVTEGLRAAFSHVDWPAIKKTARRYSDFPKYNAPAGFVFSLGQDMPVLLFGIMFSPATAGFYAMANRLSQAPITIVANSMRRVFLQKAAEISNRGGDLKRAFLLSVSALALFGAAPFVSLWLFGQELSTWLLGERWFVAGGYLEIMAPWLFMVWVAAPCNPVFIILRRQKTWLSLTTALTLLRLGAFGVAYAVTAGPEWTLQLFVIATVAGNLVTISTALVLVSRNTAHASNVASGSGQESQSDKRGQPDE